jgi:membrane protein implicated in regulation of membrane protease activity
VCLACLTPVATIALTAIGLAAWTGAIDIVAVPALVTFVLLAAYRALSARRRTPGGAPKRSGASMGE